MVWVRGFVIKELEFCVLKIKMTGTRPRKHLTGHRFG